jgi:hypothetical protein
MLSPQDQQVCQALKHVNTPSGIVAILNFDQPFPQGWQRLSYQEAQGFLHLLKPLLDEWSIVAFQQGKISGPGYHYAVEPTYSGECGEGWIVLRGAQAPY